MKPKALKCHDCGNEYQLKDYLSCKCGGILEVIYEFSDFIITNKSDNMWGYFSNLPLTDKNNIVSLKEGSTPVFNANNLAEKIGMKDLYLKDETRNPTCSFKDRPLSVGVSKAKELGKDTILIASSGNASSSASAYAAKARMKCKVFVPAKTPKEKLAQAKAYGAEVIKVKGDYSKAYKTALEASNIYGWYNVTTTYLNPYTVEGNKVVAYELYNQIGVPDLIFVPVGAGPLLFGTLKGYKELRKAGVINKIPKMVAVQPAGCSPIVDAFENNDSKVQSWKKGVTTIASGINDPLEGYEKDGTLTLKSVYESSGFAAKLEDEDILSSTYNLAEYEGIFAEPAGAVGVGAVEKLLEKNLIKQNQKVVVLVTGHGLKDTSVIDIGDLEVIEGIDDLK